jgi:Tol biopolymer transport system component
MRNCNTLGPYSLDTGREPGPSTIATVYNEGSAIMRKVIVFAFFVGATAALVAIPAAANSRGGNGRIAFARFDPARGDDFIYTANPDGSHEQQLLSTGAEIPRWSPDGTRIAVIPHDIDNVSARIVNPSDGTYRDLPNPDPELFLPCAVWSSNGQKLACEGFGGPDGDLDGIYTIRSSDGGGLQQLTSDPGGDDCPGDYSPNGKRLVFIRANSTTFALFTVKVDGADLRQITPEGSDQFVLNFECGSWSPRGNQILFSAHAPPTARSTVWAVHSDGSGLRRIPIPGCGGAASDSTSAGCFGPRWSPDGQKIIFSRFHPPEGEDIYTVNADGTGLAPAVTSSLDEGDADWATHPLVP